MRALTRSVQYMSSRQWYMVGAIALVMLTATGPGQVITLVADCYWSTSPSGPILHSGAESYLIVRSPVAAARPVYLATGFQRSHRLKDGTVLTYTDNIAVGMLIRTYAWDEGQVRLVDGVLTSDGRVMVDGRMLDRANGPNG